MHGQLNTWMHSRHDSLRRFFGPLWAGTAAFCRFLPDASTPSVTAPVAPGQGDTAQPAPAPGDSVQPAPGQGDTSQSAPVKPSDDKGPIPYDRFAEVNIKAKTFEQENAQLRAQLLQAQGYLTQIAARQGQQPSTPQPEPDPIGFNEQELLDPANIRKALLKIHENAQARVSQAVQQIQLQSQTADFDQLVGTMNPMTGQWMPSEIMAEAIREDPSVTPQLQMMGNPQAQRVFAYQIAKRQQQLRDLRAKQTTNPNPAPPAPPMTTAQAIKQAQRAPQSISTANGVGDMSKATRAATMPEAERQARWNMLVNGGDYWGPVSGT